MLDVWKRLTPHQLRWLAGAVAAAFVIAVLMSDFFSWLPGGFANAINDADLKLLAHSVPCPEGKLCLGSTTTDYYIDVPLKTVAIAAIILIVGLLYAASARSRSNSN